MVSPIEITAAIESHRFDISSEKRLQAGIEKLLQQLSLDYEREVQLSTDDRIDFMVGRIGIEVKTQGGLSPLLHQLHRYAQHEEIDELILVTSRIQLARLPEIINGKPTHVAALLALAL